MVMFCYVMLLFYVTVDPKIGRLSRWAWSNHTNPQKQRAFSGWWQKTKGEVREIRSIRRIQLATTGKDWGAATKAKVTNRHRQWWQVDLSPTTMKSSILLLTGMSLEENHGLQLGFSLLRSGAMPAMPLQTFDSQKLWDNRSTKFVVISMEQ